MKARDGTWSKVHAGMPLSDATLRPAALADVPSLLLLQSAYYEEDAYPFVPAAAATTWTALLSEPRLGTVWIMETPSGPVGYVVLTFGYSLEYRGRDAFIDELYVTPAWRGRGLGDQALKVVDAACAQLGVQALHLEVEKDKTGPQALYRRRGFTDDHRVLMTKRMGEQP